MLIVVLKHSRKRLVYGSKTPLTASVNGSRCRQIQAAVTASVVTLAPHGYCGVLDPSVTLRAEEPSQNQ